MTNQVFKYPYFDRIITVSISDEMMGIIMENQHHNNVAAIVMEICDRVAEYMPLTDVQFLHLEMQSEVLRNLLH